MQYGTGGEILQRCASGKAVILEYIPYEEVVKSQKGTILRKESYRLAPSLIKQLQILFGKKAYRKIMLASVFFPIHHKLRNMIEKYLLYKQKHIK